MLLFAWVMVLLAFFILAIQLFVTLIEFKLTTLAGFVLIPFGLFGKTAFMAERVLGNVISSGIKVLVLSVIVGIGSTLFSQFTAGFGGNQPPIDDAMAIVLAALSLLGPWHFRPRHRQRHRLRRSATRRRRCRWHRPLRRGGIVAAGVSWRQLWRKRTCRGWWRGSPEPRVAVPRSPAAPPTAYRAGGTSGAAATGLAKGTEAAMSPLRRAADSPRQQF